MKLGLRHIRYFIAVAEELHFRRAAEKLCIAQPALSRAIKELESELDVLLFIRTNRSVQITNAGKSFLEGCREVVNTVERTVENTRLAHSGQSGSLFIGYTDNAIAGNLPNLLRGFQAKQPRIALKPDHDVTVTQLQKLDAGELDIGFVTGPINIPGYEQHQIQSQEFVCITYDSHPLARHKSLPLEALAHENFVHGSPKDWEYFYSYLIPLCRRSGFIPRVVQEAVNTAGILGLVACGMGITILTKTEGESISTGLTAIPLQGVNERLLTVAVWKSGEMSYPKKCFVDYIRRIPIPDVRVS